MKHNLHKYLPLSEYFQGNVEKDVEDQIDCLVNQKNIPIQIYKKVSKINGSSVTKTIRLYPKELRFPLLKTLGILIKNYYIYHK